LLDTTVCGGEEGHVAGACPPSHTVEVVVECGRAGGQVGVW